MRRLLVRLPTDTTQLSLAPTDEPAPSATEFAPRAREPLPSATALSAPACAPTPAANALSAAARALRPSANALELLAKALPPMATLSAPVACASCAVLAPNLTYF